MWLPLARLSGMDWGVSPFLPPVHWSPLQLAVSTVRRRWNNGHMSQVIGIGLKRKDMPIGFCEVPNLTLPQLWCTIWDILGCTKDIFPSWGTWPHFTPKMIHSYTVDKPFRAPASSFFWLFLFSDLLSSSLLFSSLLFSSLTLPTSALPSVHIVGSLTSKLPSVTLFLVMSVFEKRMHPMAIPKSISLPSSSVWKLPDFGGIPWCSDRPKSWMHWFVPVDGYSHYSLSDSFLLMIKSGE